MFQPTPAAEPMLTRVALKVQLGDDIRRLKSWPAEGEEPTAEGMRRAVADLFGLAPSSISLRYRDDEGDLCHLCEGALLDALDLAARPGNGGLLRLVAECGPEHHDDFDGQEAHPRAQQALQLQPGTLVAQQGRPQEQSRLDRAWPRVGDSFGRFARQVVEDFCGARDDMRSAFRPASSDGTVSEQPQGALRFAGAAAGIVAGCSVAGGLVSLRATRFAAESIRAVASPDAAPGAAAGGDAATPARLGFGRLATPGSDGIDHFKEQVAHDFRVARQEMRDIVGVLLGEVPHPSAVGARDPEAAARQHMERMSAPRRRLPQEGQCLKQVATAVLPVIVGACITVRLASVRAARLAIALGVEGITGAPHAEVVQAEQNLQAGVAASTA
mmetsp:Transcript_102024/g.293771  ORF Transcript_102024/g.293771 Transcript_102024/m.293771 type:complete len:386 (+) Transcript_102024:92-1249(+)